MIGRFRACLICGILLAPTSPGMSQVTKQTDSEDWVCSIRDPNAADPDFFFESSLRIVERDRRLYWTLPPKAALGPKNVEIRYTLLDNDPNESTGVFPVRDGSASDGYGIDVVLLSKKDGKLRAGGMTIGGNFTRAEGTCKRK